ncbi:MAG TPA: DUF2867 domain-containing protein [Pyrinomonadaceae bacterium]|jgi:hypothetical protein
MKNITKTAIIGGAGLLAAYFLAIRPQQNKRDANASEAIEDSLIANEKITEKFNCLPLKAHSFLTGIPVHSLDYIELKGGREQMTLPEIYRATGLSDLGDVELGTVSKGLFWLRGLIGKIMHWDEVPELVNEISWLPRLSGEERAKSLIPPGEVRGISRVLYCFENEMVLEIINKTVHCFWVIASEKTSFGYNLYNVVYVKNLNWRTPVYMTLVSPVLKQVIYPVIGESIKRNWERNFPAEAEKNRVELLSA